MKVLAIDLGATNGKIYEVALKEKLTVKELKRFRTEGIFLPGRDREHFLWNLPKFYEEIRSVLESSDAQAVGIDTWGVDFALFDGKGRLISLPYHYRDIRTKGVMEKVLKVVPKEEVYRETGIQFMEINTLYQLYSMVLEGDPFLKIASGFLMIPDVFNLWLSGEMVSEQTIASTSQCYSVPKEKWAFNVLEKLSIPTEIFPEVVPPGTVLGKCRMKRNVKVIATTCHDTASAVVAVPFEEDGIYISSGTWFLIGTELNKPLLTEEAMKRNFTNERGYGKIRFLKNTTGMWLLEECNRVWRRDYSDIVKIAENSPKFQVFLDPDREEFLHPGNMLKRIRDYLEKTGQRVLDNIGEISRLIFESLAFNSRWIVEQIESLTGKRYEKIHIVGGAVRNDLLMDFIASATGKTVIAGPIDATPVGNALAQFIAMGEIKDLDEAREIVRRSFELKVFEPKNSEEWDEKYEEWRKYKAMEV
ncbi:rhamnulokinase family protein [Thermotoga sp.]|uniref:rhamnulokinase n=1 Tax=Thermotoga sp. TaxID=28240 RepID=UPI0025DF6F7E|nr:rhamnulokinase family protein [Thermotoga sp.]MCD6552177.1 rhamnulokinase [Thermotoga sp.]